MLASAVISYTCLASYSYNFSSTGCIPSSVRFIDNYSNAKCDKLFYDVFNVLNNTFFKLVNLYFCTMYLFLYI